MSAGQQPPGVGNPFAGLRAALAAGGEAGSLMAALDWEATPLGPLESWPQSLVSTVSIMLASKAQIVMFWGPEYVALYNDAYAPTIGDKHPQALGRPARENWAELWEILAPLLDGVVADGVAFAGSDYPFHIDRRGFLEDVWFDISYDPVRVEDGSVGGVFCIVSETTSRVLNERRLSRLASLDASLATVTDPVGVVKAFLDAVGDAVDDIPFARVLPAGGGTGEVPEGLDLDGPADVEELLTLGGERRALRLPLRSSAVDVGSVVLGVNPRHEFDENYLRFLRFLAERLGTALTTVRAFEAEHRVAVTLQQAILPPRLTRLAGVELDSVYLAATQGVDVGGDWFDAVEVDGGRLALVIGDVAGKGVVAAALTAQTRNALRAYLFDGRGPADALGRLNRLMLRLDSVRFSTVLCVVVDPATSTVRIANAGHLPVLRVPARGEPAYLDVRPGPPVGVVGDASYDEVEHRLTPGDVLALFTDGLIEERSEAIDVGLARAAAATAGATSAAEVLARLRALRGDGRRPDDIAVVTARPS